MKSPAAMAIEIVNELHFASNRMFNGRLVGEQHFAAEAITRAIKVDRLEMAGTITMNEIRMHVGVTPGRLSHKAILAGVNAILRSRAENAG